MFMRVRTKENSDKITTQWRENGTEEEKKMGGEGRDRGRGGKETKNTGACVSVCHA